MMKNALLLFALLFSTVSYAQAPFTNYFGQSGRVNQLVDFTRSGDGNYLLHTYGNYNAPSDRDLGTYQASIDAGIIDSSFTALPGLQQVHRVMEDGNGGAIVCARARQADRVDHDILLQYLDASGESTGILYLGSERKETVELAEIDEDGNVFIGYVQALSEYPRTFSLRVAAVAADRELIYDTEIDFPAGGLIKLFPLDNGELLIIGYVFDEVNYIRAALTKLAADGTVSWQNTYNQGVSGITLTSQAVYSEETLYLADHSQNKLVTLDLNNGDLISFFDYTSIVSSGLDTPFAFYDDDLWILRRENLYKLRLQGSTYMLTATFPLQENSVIMPRYREEGKWEFLNGLGQLRSIDLNTQTVETLVEIEGTAFNPVTERTMNVLPQEDRLLAGVGRYPFGLPTVFVNIFSAVGELESSVSSFPLDEQYSGFPTVMALPDGGSVRSAIVREAPFNQRLILEVYDATGGLTDTHSVFGPENNLMVIYNSRLFPDGSIGIFARVIGSNSRYLVFRIDLQAPVFTPIVDFNSSIPFSIFQVFDDGSFALTQTPYSEEETVTAIRKYAADGSLLWTAESALADAPTQRTYEFSTMALEQADNGNLLLGANLQVEDNAPVYYFDLFDENGISQISFTAPNTYLSAYANFLNDDRIALVGCSINPANTGADDLYLLRYEIYDLQGDLQEEYTNELANELAIAGLEVLDGGSIAIYGSVYTDNDPDAMVIVINAAGEITSVSSPLVLPWGSLVVGPNPSDDLLRVQFSNEYQGELAVNLYTATGQIVRQWSAGKSGVDFTWEASLTELPAGTYWVQVKSPKGQVMKGWVKN